MTMSLEYPLHSPDFYTGDPYPAYQTLRAEDPVHWHAEREFWAILKYRDIRYISANPGLFTSTRGITIPEPGVDAAASDGSMIFTDPPLHRQLRKLVISGFTPRQIAILEPRVRDMAREILDSVEAGSEVDFGEQIASPLPTMIIAELIGAPRTDWEQFRAWSDAIVGSADPDIVADVTETQLALHEYFSRLIADRKDDRRDDVISILLGAEVDGERLSDEDLYRFCWLLLIAGNETTRQSDRAGHVGAHSPPGAASAADRRSVTDHRGDRRDVAMDQSGDAHGPHRAVGCRAPGKEDQGRRRIGDALWVRQQGRGDLRTGCRAVRRRT